MQKRFGMMFVLVLALSLVFCFGATAWADEDVQNTEETETTEQVDGTNEGTEGEEAAEEETVEDKTVEEQPAVFTDVPADYWAYDYIMDIFKRELTSGTSATTFGPDATLTRAQFVTFLGRLAAVNEEEYAQSETVFTDIGDASIAYAYSFICWAADIGVTTGATTTTFNPQGQLTREQMATMVKRFADYFSIELQNEDTVTIADADAISTYAQVGVNALVPVFISLQDGKFNPQALATRAEMAQVLSLFPVPEAGFGAADEVVPSEVDTDNATGEVTDETTDGETTDGEVADDETDDGKTDDEKTDNEEDGTK